MITPVYNPAASVAVPVASTNHAMDAEWQRFRLQSPALEAWMLADPVPLVPTGTGPTEVYDNRRFGAAINDCEPTKSLEQTAYRALNPLKSSLFPCPKVPDNQNGQEDGHFCNAKPAQVLVAYRPRKKEHSLHVENYEQDGNDVEADGISSARIGCGLNTAFVGF